MNNISKKIADLSPEKLELFLKLRNKKKENFQKKEISPQSRETGLFPLSFAQARLWFLDQLMPGNHFYNIPYALRVAGELDVLALKLSLNEIIRRHETLHTSFEMVDGQPTQLVAESWELTLTTIDLQSLPKLERDRKAHELAYQVAQQPFDLRVAPLMQVMLLRLAPTEHVLVFVMHHIISDGWSIGVFHRELAILYDAFVKGKTSPLPELSIQYADFAVWQRTWLEQTSLKKQLQYWLQQLADIAVLKLPTDYPRPSEQSFRGGLEILKLPENLKQGLVKLSREHGVTLFMTLLAAFKVLLHRYTGQTDIAIGSPIANRNRSEVEPLIGFFVNTLVLRTQCESNLRFDELLTRVQEVALGAYAHQGLPFERLVEELQPERHLDSNPLVQVVFAVQNAPMAELQLTGLQLSRLELEYNTTRFDMEWHVWEQPQGLQVMVAYATDLFAQETIKRMLGYFQTLLDSVVANPQQQLFELPLLSTTQQQQLLFEWNDTERKYPHHKCIHQLFEEKVEQTPDAVALVFSDEQLTYNELNVRANQLAHYLQSMGIEPEVLVGLCVERSPEMLVGMLGILKAGGAYVPLDPSYPIERLAYILSDAKVSVLLTQQKLVEKLSPYSTHVVCLDLDIDAQQSQDNPSNRMTPNHLAYVMYTSGSTGLPKGVSVVHQGIVRLVKETNYVKLNADEVFLQLAPIAFDASTFEIWGGLLNGGRLVIMPPHTPSLSELGQAVEQHQVTTLWLTAGLFHLMVDQQLKELKNVRQLLAGGDVLSVPHVVKVVEQLPQLSLINGYGPTENTTFTCCYPIIQPFQVQGTVPIGRPIANTQVYVLNEQLQPVPIGVAGELYTSGDGLSRGYLNRPQLTASKFLPNPFSLQPGTRLYKTGDKARYLANGNIEFLGRIDNQVKLRGYRIELGEIESLLNQHPLVQQAVAILREDSPGLERIVAYCTQDLFKALETTIESTTQLPTEHLKQWQTLYDQTYAQENQESDASFNIIGWNSSYTNQPIPSEQMRQWLNGRVNHLLACQPQRVLEIGCGTGLLLFQIAPHCEHYYSTDFSDVAIDAIAQQLRHPEWHLPQVELQQKLADDFEGIKPGSFDTVILNSVVQYFPSIDYLLQVLVGAVKALAPGGIVFVGDVRSLPLREAFHASVQLYQAEDKLDISRLRQRVQIQMAQETELVIDPEFFLALKEHLPQIASVQIRLQRGEYHNELTSFRYDVTLEVGSGQSTPQLELSWHNWESEGLTLESTAQLLESQPKHLGIVNIPNARVISAIKTVQLLSSDECPSSVIQLRTAINSLTPESGVEPEQLWSLAQQHEYILAISWSETELGCYDVVFMRQSTKGAEKPVGGVTPLERKKVQPKAWQYYANNPLQTQNSRQLQSQLRDYLSASLPEYMLPSAIVMLDALPLTANGKVDRKALPAPEGRVELSNSFVAPRTEIEQMLTHIWTGVLNLEKIGIHDNFFELGGDSILSIQIVAKANQAGIQLTTKQMFEHQTIAELATVAQTTTTTHQAEQSLVTGLLPLTPIQHWFFNQNLPDPSHWNQAFLLSVQPEISPEILEPAIQQLLVHHDALRLRFERTDLGWQQINANVARTVSLKRVDLSAVPQAEQISAISAAATQLQASLNLAERPLVGVAWFYLGNHKANRLLLVIHHLAVDGVSWRILLEDLQTAYEQLSRTEAIVLPPKTTSFKQWSHRLVEYAQSEALIPEMAYWLRESDKQVAEIPVDYPEGTNTASSALTVSVSLSVKETQSLLYEVPTAYNTQINDVLLTVLGQVFSEWAESSCILFNLEGHGRENIVEDVDLSRTIGWFTTIFPVLLEIAATNNLADTLKSVKEQLRRIPNRGIGYGLLRYLRGDGEITSRLEALPQAQVSFNYLGQFDEVLNTSVFHRATESPGQSLSLLGNRSHLLDVYCLVVGGQLQLDWSYSENVHRRSTIEGLAQKFLATLQELIVECLSSEAGGWTPSDFPAAKVSQKDLDNFIAQLPQVGNQNKKNHIEDIFQLSPMQEDMLFHSLYAPDNQEYCMHFSLSLHGHLNVRMFEQAWQQVVARHTALRCAFYWQGLDKPLQVVYRQVKVPMEIYSWQGIDSQQQQQKLEAFLQSARERGCQLNEAPLVRLTLIQMEQEVYESVWSFHHILIDGWSWSLIVKEVSTLYEAFCQGQELHLQPSRSYREYIIWLQQQNLARAEEFWRSALKGFNAPTPLVVGRGPFNLSNSVEEKYGEEKILLSAAATDALQSFAKKHQLTLNQLVQGAWALLLSRYSGQPDVVFGVVVSGRPPAMVGVESVVGLFINTLPMRVTVSDDDSVLSWLKRLQHQQVEISQYDYTPLVEIQGWSQVPRGLPLFESIMVFENYPIDAASRQGIFKLYLNNVRGFGGTNYALTLVAVPEVQLSLRLSYDAHRFEAATISQMLGHLQTLLLGMSSNPDQRVFWMWENAL